MNGNKWEWAEFYAFLKILSEKSLPSADSDMEIVGNERIVFHSVTREESPGDKKVYELGGGIGEVRILDGEGNELLAFFDGELPNKTRKIFEGIKNAHGRSFTLEHAGELMEKLLCNKLKPSCGRKEDIVWTVGSDRKEVGFSIKSTIGWASTLLNASEATNFAFEITGFSWDILAVNALDDRKSKIRDRIKAIRENGGIFEYRNPKSETFLSNLRSIDGGFDAIIGNMLLNFFQWKWNSVKGLLKLEDGKNGFSMNALEIKTKSFLDAIATGMVPSKTWNGRSDTKGGIIVIKWNWEAVCCNLYDRDEFRDYLFGRTKFETASSGKHKFASLYEKWGRLYFDLNLQIRF